MRQRPPRSPGQVFVEGSRAQRVQSAGRVVNASPVPRYVEAAALALQGTSGTTSIEFENTDIFDITSDGPQDVPLTFLPIEKSLHVELNGVKADLRTEWSLSGQTLSLLSPLDVRAGDVVTTEYAYYTGLPESVTVYAGDYPSTVMTDSPVAYWRLDEASGTSVADYTGHGHTGTTAAGSGSVTRAQTTLLTAGNGGVYSTKFLGYGARVNVPTSSAFHGSQFSIEFFTSKGGSTANPIWHHPGRLRVLQSGTATVVAFWVSGAWQNVWTFAGLTGSDDTSNHHVVITYDGTTMKRYIEGVLDSGSLVSGAALPTTSSAGPEFGDGLDGTNTGECFRLQEFAYYDHALTAARVSAHVAVR